MQCGRRLLQAYDSQCEPSCRLSRCLNQRGSFAVGSNLLYRVLRSGRYLALLFNAGLHLTCEPCDIVHMTAFNDIFKAEELLPLLIGTRANNATGLSER